MTFRGDVGEPCTFQRTYRLCISCCREVAISKSSKKVALGPRFVGEGIPQISHIHFQIALTSDFRACDRFWLSSVQRARRVADEKRRR